MSTMEKHFVTFYSPGTFVAETDIMEIHRWSVRAAIKLARQINQRYNARPYGFRFITRSRNDKDFDSKETARSPMYYLGGEIKTLEQVEAENNPKDRILLSNMRYNHWGRIIINRNSWKWTQPLEENDVVIGSDYLPPKMSFFDYLPTMANNYQDVVRRGIASLEEDNP